MMRITGLLFASVLAAAGLAGAAQGWTLQAAQPAQPAATAPQAGSRGLLIRLDADHDGVITKAEAEAAASARFDRIDTNHDGRIDQTEIAAARAGMHTRMNGMRAKWQARRAGAAQAAPSGQ